MAPILPTTQAHSAKHTVEANTPRNRKLPITTGCRSRSAWKGVWSKARKGMEVTSP